jgi:hypothetical protein
MEAFIPVVSDLQDVITKIGQSHKVEFPQIVTLGAQVYNFLALRQFSGLFTTAILMWTIFT